MLEEGLRALGGPSMVWGLAFHSLGDKGPELGYDG
jgi:hypothetical protein